MPRTVHPRFRSLAAPRWRAIDRTITCSTDYRAKISRTRRGAARDCPSESTDDPSRALASDPVNQNRPGRHNWESFVEAS
jgi:hypothetical protein